MADDRGAPIAYTVLAAGTRVEGRDGTEVGTVRRVLADEGADIFDGLILHTHEGERFVDAGQVGDLYEHLVVLQMTGADAAHLPEPTPSPAAVDVDADDIAGETPGERVRDAARRAWNRISGNY